MKSEEAIEIVIHCLGVLAGYEVCEECKIYGDDDLACREVARYAIEALKEVQRYQLIKDVTIGEIAEALKAFSEIGTVEECRKAVEKQKPKKPIPINYQDYADKIDNAEFFEGSYFCPNCGTVLRSGSYCNRCGQKLGWNENLEGMEDE